MHSLINHIGNAINLGYTSKTFDQISQTMANQKGMHTWVFFFLISYLTSILLHLSCTCFQLQCTHRKCAFNCFIKSFQFASSKSLQLYSQNFFLQISKRNKICAFVHNLLAFFWSHRCPGTILIGMEEEAPLIIHQQTKKQLWWKESMDDDLYSANHLRLQCQKP
jgi:hypothetical protein